MPFLGGKAFSRKEPRGEVVPEGTRLFVNEVTGERSPTYKDHCARLQQTLDPIWFCSITGRGGLTFKEARQSEKDAMEVVGNFPVEFAVPLLYLASRTHCVEIKDMVEAVYQYVENRYFVGEVVEAKYEDGWCSGYIVEVNTSLDNEVESSQRSGANLPANVFYYTVVLTVEDKEITLLAEADNLRRRQGKESITEYLALVSEKSQDGIWKIRDHVYNQCGLRSFRYQNIFWGSPPDFKVSEGVCEATDTMSDPNKEVGKKVLQVTLERYFGPHSSKRAMEADPENPPPFKKQKHTKTDAQKPAMDVSSKSKVAGKDLHAQRKVGQSSKQKDRNPKGKQKEKKESRTHEGRSRPANLESVKREKLLLKERLRMLKAVDRAKRKQEKFERARLAREARIFKEDLECEDLKVLPTFSEVQCCIPNEKFAEFMVLLEFVHSFKEVLPVNDFFPHGFSFDVAERALSVEEADGTFSDIIQLLMTGFFKMQGLDDEIENSTEPGQLKIDLHDDIERALELATATRKYTRLCHGVQLKQFRLDAFSLSEVVRLHFLTSGGYMEDGRTKYRYLRGGYCDRDDPGLTFCIAESKLLNDIAYRSIQELALGDKLKIILCLIHQLLTFPTLRDILDDRCEKIRPLKNTLRIHSRAEKKLSDSLTLRLKERNATKTKGEEEMPSDAQNIVTDEDFQAEQNRIEKQILRKRQNITKTAKELAEISMSFQSLPLGTDRFFRRYWRFSSLPGLFIEHQGGASIEALSSGAAYNFSAAPVSDIGDNPANSDKENDDNEGCKSRSSNSPTKKMLVENNSNDSLTSEKLGAALQSSNKCENDPKDVNLHQDVVSTKNREFLGSSEPLWSFCCKEDEFNLLLERLNPRGIREGHLRQVLLGEKERILESILSCPAVKLNPAFVDETIVPEVRKSSRNNPASSKDGRNFGHPLGTPLPEIWSQLLRDEILDTDDRLYRGGLGAVQVQNRDAWREALLNKTYDKQCDRLVWGCQAKSDKQESSQCSIKTGNSEDIESTDPEFQRVMKSPFHFVQLSLMDPGIIKAYACAILQVEQGIPRKNLKPSFVADKPGEEISQLERWEMSLMSSTSYSQLYVHLLTLHNNIHWSRSALKAHCRACRRRYDAENMLLCDECNRGYHIYCLTPKLNRIPHGDWYCSACQPKVAAQRNKRQHRSTSEEHEAEASACKPSADRCDVCGLSSTSFACTTCHRRFHVECCDPTKMKRTSSNWQCRTCTLHEKREIKKVPRLPFCCKEAHGLYDSKSQAELSSVQI